MLRWLANIRKFNCTSYQYDTISNKPQMIKKSKIHLVKEPGEFVLVDQLQFTTPKFIAWLKGGPTCKKYTCVAVMWIMQHDKKYAYARKFDTRINIKNKKNHLRCVQQDMVLRHKTIKPATVGLTTILEKWLQGKSERIYLLWYICLLLKCHS